jgi:RimJ/RimL family protein N-acetyltransferase
MKSIYKRGGWKHEGTEREYTYRNGKWIDKEIWAVLRSKYKEK